MEKRTFAFRRYFRPPGSRHTDISEYGCIQRVQYMLRHMTYNIDILM